MPSSETGQSSCSLSNNCMSLDSNDTNNEFNRNFNESLLGLKALNNQTEQEITISEFLKRMDKKDEDVVILDETPKLLHENGKDSEFPSKPNKFTINETIRNSFKDIISSVKISKPQENSVENENSLGNLLAKTKSIGLESRDRNTINLKNNNAPNGFSEKLTGNNLFENLQGIHNSQETQEKTADTQESSVKASAKDKPEVIDLDDSLEDELLKSGNSETETKDSSHEHKELDKKEEDKLLQIDMDVSESSDDKSKEKLEDNANDLKIENKLLELDNENSNHSMTSVKSDHSVKSTHSVKSNASDHSVKSNTSDHSVKSNASNHSVKSNTSDHSVKSDASNHSVKSNASAHSVKSIASEKSVKSTHSNTSIHSTKLSAQNGVISDIVLNHNDSSNHSVKSNTSNHSAKSITSVHNTDSRDGIGDESIEAEDSDSEKLDISNQKSSNSHKTDINDPCIKSDSNNTKKLDKTELISQSKEIDETSKSGETQSNNKDIELNNEQSKESISETSDDISETSKDDKSTTESSCDIQCEKMDVDDSEEVNDKLPLEKTLSDSIKNTDSNDSCSIKSESCDSDLKSDQMPNNLKDDKDMKNCDSDRKRPAEPDESLSSLPKRSRLDDVIGKLGTQIGIPLDRVKTIDELSDTDATDASHLDSEMTESKSEETSTDTDVDEDEDEDVMKMKSPVKSPKKTRRVSQKELAMIVKAKVMLYLRTYRDETIKDLHRRIDDLTHANDHWKNKARDLERRMLELTVLQQKHEKRKAKTAALRQISSKSIGIQVDENKVEKPIISSPTHVVSKEIAQNQNQSSSNKSGNKTPPRSVAPSTILSTPAINMPAVSHFLPITNLTPPKSTYNTSSATQSQIQQALNLPLQRTSTQILLSPPIVQKQVQAIQQPVQAIQQPVQQAIQQTVKAVQQQDQSVKYPPTGQTVKSLLDTSRQQQQQQQKTVPNSLPVVLSTPGLPKIGQLSQPQFIMVTSDPSISTKANIPATTVTNATAKPQAKIIDLTDEEEGAAKQTVPQVTKIPTTPAVVSGMQPQGLIRALTPQQTNLPQQQILLSGPGGRFVNPAQPQYQLVFNSASSNIRPGSLVTVVTTPGGPGLRPATVSQPPALPPPQLRAAQLVPLTSLPRPNLAVTSVASGIQQTRTVRPPPPLQSAPTTQNNQTKPQIPLNTAQIVQPPVGSRSVHPAPLPVQDPPPIKPGEKPLAPKPTLKISRVSQGIVLSWNMTYIAKNHAEIQSYQLFAYQETSAPATSTLWKKVGDVKALPLPMACTLTQFQEGNRYHFAVRPIDVHSRPGPFSEPSSIHLMAMK